MCRYQEAGFFISPPIVPGALLDRAWQAIQDFIGGRRGRFISELASSTDRHIADGAPFEQLGYLALQLPEVEALVRHPAIARAAAALSDSTAIRLFHDRTIIKPPSGDAEASVGWHTDRAYWRTCSSDRLLTAWVPFDDVDEESGALMVVEGSHRWDGNEGMATALCTDMDALAEQVVRHGADFRPVPMTMKRGQASFHHCRAVHGSFPARGRKPRAAIAIHMQPGDNHYRPFRNAEGRLVGHTNDLICRQTRQGHPDYSDPAVFLPMWPQPA